MYSSWDKSVRGDKSKKLSSSSSTTLPSFSSTLLDEIYNSIDAGDRIFRDKRNAVKDEEQSNINRSGRVENKDIHHHDKIFSRRRQSLPDYDRAFFTSSWSSSDSSSGGETEYKPRNSSCFTAVTPLTVRTTTSRTSMEKTPKSSNKSYPTLALDSKSRNHDDQDSEAKSKLRALKKMYNNLSKGKQQQPISPGVRLTTFLNSLFRHHGVNSKKSKKQSNDDVYHVQSKPRQASTSSSSTSSCSSSSSSSYHRSCQITTNKTSPDHHVIVNPKEKKPIQLNNGSKRRVRFDPVSVIVDDQDDDDDDNGSDISSDLFELDHLTFMGSYDHRDYNQELPVYETTRRPVVGSRRIIY